MDNLVLECIQKRRSIRGYSSEALEPKQIEALVQAALISPSAMNHQPWHLTVVQNVDMILEIEKDIIDYFKEHGPESIVEKNESRENKIFYNAPTVFFISVKNQDGLLDVGIVAQTINLAAVSMGLNSVTLGLPQVAFLGTKGEEWKSKLKFPEGYNYGIAVAVGYGQQPGNSREADQSKVDYIV